MAQLKDLHVNDEFTIQGVGSEVYKLLPTDEGFFLDTAQLRVKNPKTGNTGLLPENTPVTLANHAG